MIRKCFLLVVLDATDLLGSTKSVCSAARVILRTTSMMVRRFSNKVEARTCVNTRSLSKAWEGSDLHRRSQMTSLPQPRRDIQISRPQARRTCKRTQSTGSMVYSAFGTYASNHPPCSSSSSAFSLVIDLQNSCVLTSHRRALSSAYTSNKLSSPKHTRSSRPGPPGTRYNLVQ